MLTRNRRGPLFTYWQLSYRQKFYRTVWMFPFACAFFLFPADVVYFGLSRNAMLAILFIALLAQAVYTYVRWKTTESAGGEGPEPTDTPDAP